MQIRNRVRQVLKTLNLTQEKFGKAIGYSQSQVGLLLNGQRNIKDKHLLAICLAFNVSEDWLRTGKGEMFLPSKKSGNDLDAFRRVLKAKIQALPPEGQSLILELCKDIEAAAKSPGQEEPEGPD